MSHTPGPWHVGGVFNPGTPDEAQNVWSEPPPGMQSGDQIAQYVRPADARLIAAAPELLAELRIIANADPSKWDADTRDQFQEWAQNRARAAIAKATVAPEREQRAELEE